MSFVALFPFFTATAVLLLRIAHSCSWPMLDDGTKWISDVQLLNGTLDDVLLTIRTKGSSDVYCQNWNAINGELGSVIECDTVTTRAWNDGAVDASGTDITSVVADTENDGLTVVINRNGEQLTIADIPYANASSGNHELFFKSWTMNSLNATFLAVSYEMYSVPRIFGIQFANLNKNDNYEVLTVSAAGNEFDANFDVTSSFEIAVFESINLIQFPLVCCLCESSFIAQYELQTSNVSGHSTFNANSVFIGGSVDVAAQRIYGWSIQGNTLRVYDANSGLTETYELDLNSTTVTSTSNTDVHSGGNTETPSSSNALSLSLQAIHALCVACFVTHLINL